MSWRKPGLHRASPFLRDFPSSFAFLQRAACEQAAFLFLFSQSNNDRQLLAMVETALQRIREGEFGECVNCGNEINPKRLEAVPWTRYCIACQEKLENGQLEEVEE